MSFFNGGNQRSLGGHDQCIGILLSLNGLIKLCQSLFDI